MFSCPSDSRLHMMSSTSLQSTFAILKKKKMKKKRHFILSTFTKEMHIYYIKVSQTQHYISHTQRSCHTFRLQNVMRSSPVSSDTFLILVLFETTFHFGHAGQPSIKNFPFCLSALTGILVLLLKIRTQVQKDQEL